MVGVRVSWVEEAVPDGGRGGGGMGCGFFFSSFLDGWGSAALVLAREGTSGGSLAT